MSGGIKNVRGLERNGSLVFKQITILILNKHMQKFKITDGLKSVFLHQNFHTFNGIQCIELLLQY